MSTNLSISIKDFNDFKSACNHFDIEINNNQLNLFKKYYETLLEWNKKINLISRKEENILERHFLDSILFLPEINNVIARRCEAPTKQSPDDLRNEIASVASLPRNDKIDVLDIGSGGGFPAIPLAIMKPKWKFTLCESIKKKANFLEYLVKELNLTNVEIINARVETLRATSLHKNKFDFITARAVARLDVLIKYSLPLLKKGGYLLAYKAKDIDEEIKKCKGEVISPLLKIFEKEVNGVVRKLIVLQM